MAEKRRRFEDFSDEQIQFKRKSTIPKATLKNNDKWDRAFRSYLMEKGVENTQYWYYPDEELDHILCKFWFEARSQRAPLNEDQRREALAKNLDPYPERYTIASLHNLRNGLSRCLADHGKNIDLTTDPKFINCQCAFKDACKELKQFGKGNVNSYPEIEHSGNTIFRSSIKVPKVPIF